MDTCIDPTAGALLHAYELGILPGVDESRFEIHILTCDACRLAIEKFEDEAVVLRTSGKVRQVLAARPDISSASRPASTRFWAGIWPETPMLLRPGLLYLALLLLLFPAFVGVEQMTAPNSSTKLTQVIRLVQSRGAMDNSFSVTSGLDGVVSFEIPNAMPGKRYQVNIVADNGTNLGHWEGIISPGNEGIINLVIPNSKMIPGKCRLTITDPLLGQTPPVAQYRFEIEQ